MPATPLASAVRRATRRSVLGVTVCCFVLGASAGLAGADKYKFEVLKESPPKSVAKNVQAVVQETGLRVLDGKGKPSVDVWLRKSLTTQKDNGAPGVDYGTVPEGSVLGLIRVHKKGADFRGHKFRAGTYLLRSALQPEDGEHQGTAANRDFLLLCPSKGEIKLDPMPTKEVVKLSVEVSGAKHPSILYLVKLFSEPEGLPKLIHDDDYEYWILDCQIPDAKKGNDPVRLSIVLVGKAEE